MNFGKYSIDDAEDDMNLQQGDRRAERQEPAVDAESPHPGDWQSQLRGGVSTGARRRTRPRSPYPAAAMGFPGAFFAQPPVQPAYWSTTYSDVSTPSGPHLTLYSGYTPWAPPPQGSPVTGFPSTSLGDLQRPYTRSMARKRAAATYVNAKLKWTERGSQLLIKVHPDAVYSVKVFVGGLPLDITTEVLERAFQDMAVLKVLKGQRQAHAYLILASDFAVKNLLLKCEAHPDGAYFFPIGTRNAQVIPWALQDIEWGHELEGSKSFTIFVGGLHGETTAEHLKLIMEEKFGQVRHVKVDTDRYKYPSGSARVQFVFQESYVQAIDVNFLEINTKHYSRTVQLEPYFEKNQLCSRCKLNKSSVICRHVDCLNYFCRFCFESHQQQQGGAYHLHQPIGLN